MTPEMPSPFGGTDSDWTLGRLGSRVIPPLGPASGRFLTTSSLYLSVELRVPELPREGQNLRASSAVSTPGGGYIGAAAARAQGVESWCVSPLGTGPNSHSIRRRMRRQGIETVGAAVVGDIGVGVSMVEVDGRIASVRSSGVEVETSRELLDSLPPVEGDLVLIHGGDLAVEPSASVLSEWACSLPSGVGVVLAVSPAVEQVDPERWLPLLERADIVTMNIREAAGIRDAVSGLIPGTGIRHLVRPEAAIIRRTGSMGCEVQQSLEEPIATVPGFPSTVVDTTGVGDTHVAVMCAALLQGEDLLAACRRANAAGALMIRHMGPFPVPTRAEVDRVLERGGAVPA